MPRITDVVKNLLIINILVFVSVYISLSTGLLQSPAQLALFYPTDPNFRPYQIVTHMFMHGDIGHLMFNMLTLFFLGPPVEQFLGAKKFLILYFVSGLGALLTHWLFFHHVPIIGASGAIYGVLIAFAVLFPNTRLMLLFPPIPVRAKYLVIFIIAFDLISGVSGWSTGIAHFAHLGGGLFGFIMLAIWNKVQFKR